MNEMFIVYLYGIYPTGTMSIMATMYFIILGLILFFMGGPMDETDNAIKFFNKVKTYSKIALAVLIIGALIPSKNIFLAMVATPHIINSLELKTGKLYKIDKLLDNALNNALKDLNVTKQTN